MRLHDSTLILTPTDIANHLACRHLTQLDRARLAGERIELRLDPRIDALRHRGETHEKGFVDSLAAEGLSITDVRSHDAPAAPLDARTAGADVIVQAPLQGDRISGRADVLLRIGVPSRLGAYSYEPADTKLARDTRAGTILQLCAYAALLDPMQGLLPEHIHVVTPLARERYRTAHFDAYFRFVRRRLEDDLAADPPPATYPEPVPHCDVCPYWLHCDRRRRADDHLSLVAGIRKLNVRELERLGIRVRPRAGGVRGVPGLRAGAAGDVPGSARVPLRRLRAGGTEAPRLATRDARRGARRPAPRRPLRRSARRRPRRASHRRRAVRAQGARAARRLPARARPPRRRAGPPGRRAGARGGRYGRHRRRASR